MSDTRPRLPADLVALYSDEARALWDDERPPTGALIGADLARVRTLAAAAEPALTDWEWGLVSHVLPDEMMRVFVKQDTSLPSGARLAAEITEWADSAPPDEMLRAEALAARVRSWGPLEVWSLLIRVRGERIAAWVPLSPEDRKRRLHAQRMARYRAKLGGAK